MANLKDIRDRIKSVRSIQKVTKAMKMVAAAKMRKAQEKMMSTRPYGEKVRNVIAHLSYANPEFKHPYLIERDTVKRAAMITESTIPM